MDTAKIQPCASDQDPTKMFVLAREPYKEYALKIALKFVDITKQRKDTKDYK